jgi:hypothetical protein
MDARTLFIGCLTAIAVHSSSSFGTGGVAVVLGAERHETANFVVTAADRDVAEQVARAAEYYRRELAVYWLGKPMPTWSRPCRVSVNVGALGAGGQTTFQFVNGEVLNWRMSVQGSLERILDSVIPHEVNHTIFACHFRRPLPRWADEGAATLFEHESEKSKQLYLLNQVIRDRGRHFSLGELLSMKDYPEDPQRMLTLYAQGFTLVDFLVQQKGRKVYLELLGAAEERGWEEAIRTHFDHEGIVALERNWRGWVLAGRPRLLPGDGSLLASAEADGGGSVSEVGMAERSAAVAPVGPRMPRGKSVVSKGALASGAVVRSQSPDTEGVARTAEVARAPSSSAAGIQIDLSSRSRSSSVSESGGRRGVKPGFRSATFEAPVPGSESGSGAGNLGSGEGWFDETRPSAGVVEGDSVSSVRGSGFESTGHVVSEAAGVRPATIDGTPAWAGFPGSLKFF